MQIIGFWNVCLVRIYLVYKSLWVFNALFYDINEHSKLIPHFTFCVIGKVVVSKCLNETTKRNHAQH